MKVFAKNLYLLGFAVSISHQAIANDEVSLDAVSIVGDNGSALNVAGSVTQISADELAKFEYTDVQRILSSVPGVSFRNEEGYGLRPNISIRGTRDDRSGKITLMEDGVLIAPAPYSASSAYYFPSAGRIHAIEVVKGSGAIENGPYTIGGALNIISTPIPYRQSGEVTAEYGTDNTARLHAWTGDSKQNYGWLVEAQRHQSEGFATIDNAPDDTGFEKNDILAKFRVNTDKGANVYQQLEFKLQYSDEVSDQTYVGLTESDFAKDPHNRYGLTQQDEMDNEHKEFTVSHLLEFGNTSVDTTAYYVEFARDWFKVDKINGDGIDSVINCANGFGCNGNTANQTDANAILKGSFATDVALKHNNRKYESKGIQTRVEHSLATSSIEHTFKFGLRYHEDSEDRSQPTETWKQLASGAFNFDSISAPATRYTSAKAWSAFIKDDMSIGDLTLSPGVRLEDYKIEREGSSDKVADEQITLFGLGSTYRVSDAAVAFLGIHEGHSPAANDGTSKPEEALNFELGLRYSDSLLQAEAGAFWSDYSNLLGTCTASGGAGDCNIGDTSNAGAATIKGIELVANSSIALTNSLIAPIGITYTYTDAQFDNSFSDSGVWGTVNKGDKLPSLPDNQLQLRAGLQQGSWGVDINTSYFSETCATASCAASEKIDAYAVVDLAARYRVTPQAKLYLNIENLLDSEDVVARAPKNGARAQKPLTALVGLNYQF